MTVNAASTVFFRDIADVMCLHAVGPVTYLKNPVQAFPCKHIFERAAVQSGAELSSRCPLDQHKIESIKPVVYHKRGESGIENVDFNSIALDMDKTEALKMLERSALIPFNGTKNFVGRASQITVRHRIEEEAHGTLDRVEFTGPPIDQLFVERSGLSASLFKYPCVIATLRTALGLDGSYKGCGYEISVIDNGKGK